MSASLPDDDSVDFAVLRRLEGYSSPEDNLIAALIEDYEKDSEKLLARMTQQVAENDLNGIHYSAHGLRSISECLGMVLVASHCQRFEDITEINPAMDADVKALSRQVEKALSLIKGYWSAQV